MVSKQQLSQLSAGELREVIANAQKYLEEREAERAQELWRRVMYAMQEYCNETGDDIVTDDDRLIAIGKGYDCTCGVLYTGC